MANTSRNSIDGQNGQTARNTSLLQPVRGQQYQIAGVAPLGTNDYFGPAQPFLPMGPPGARGRVFDYPIAENIRIEPRDDEPLSFWDLIALAENHDVTRLCIETRKDQMESLQFNIRPKGSTGKKGKDKDQQYRIDKTEDFFKVPDGKHPFETWQREIMEQCLVIDATTIYIDKTRPKNTRLTVMDGAMIKRLIDENGQSPEHPWPAYQQFVKGMPSWDYTDKEIYYAPRNRRVHKLYGMSVVQQIYLCVNVALRRETSVLQYFCYSNDTEVLTKRGWLRFSETTMDDEFATRNIETKAFEWQKPTDTFRKRYTGDMVHFRGKSLDLLVTPHHRMLVTSMPESYRVLKGIPRRQGNAGECVISADALATFGCSAQAIPQTSMWKGKEIKQKVFGEAGYKNTKPVEMTGDQYCAFMGMYLADGSATDDHILIYKTPEKDNRGTYQLWQNLLRDIFGPDLKFEQERSFDIGRRPLAQFCKQFGRSWEKYIPDDIREATPRQLAIFWKYYYMGDGAAAGDESFDTPGPSQQCSTKSRKLADQLCEILQKMGFAVTTWNSPPGSAVLVDKETGEERILPSREGWTITKSFRKQTSGWHAEFVPYDDDVCCVSVPNTFLYVRRNGKCAWSGNTDGNIPDALMGVPETWTAQQIRDAQLAFDSLNSGNYAQRRRMRFIPGGSKYYPTREINLKTEFDEWLARIVCFAFNIPPTPFIKQSSRASASTMQEVAISEGLMPLMRWFTMMMNYMIQADHILAQSDLEFAYVEREESDPAARDKIWDAKIRRGQATVNEARAAEGDDPIPGGDTAMIYMGQGPIPLEMAANQAKMQLPSPDGGAAPGAPGGGSPAVKPPAARPASPAAGQPPNPGMKPIIPPAAKPAPNGRPTTTGKPLQRPTTKAEEVDESSRSPFSIEKVGQPRSQIVAEAEVNIQNTFSQAFENLSASASAYIEEAANHPDIGKADEEDKDAEKPLSPEEKAAMAAALDAVDSLSLEELIVTIDPTSEALEAIAEDGAEESIASIAVEPPSGVLADANPRVIAWAKERAAELIGKKVLPSGEIIDNPDAEWAIDEPTRVMLRQTITESFQSGKGIQGLAKEIENSYAFSHERAMLIARTETINAFNSGAFIGYQEMAKQGVDLEKKWVDHPGACPVCIANAAAGYIGLNEPFPSGHQHPTAHPKCRCTFVAIARRDDDKV